MRAGSLAVAAALVLHAAAAHALPPDQETEHVVGSGETLNGIANRAKVSRDAIIRANGLKPPYILRVGEKLAIPRGGRTASRSITTRSAPPSGTSTYTVKAGETLGGIANREKVPRVLIAEANRLKPPYTLRTGQKLYIPRTRHHVVKAGETGFGIAYAYAVPWSSIAVANGLDPDGGLQTGQKLLIPAVLPSSESAGKVPNSVAASPAPSFAWPVTGPVRRDFDKRGGGSYHDGLDITAPKGTAVRASAAGTVIFARREADQFGNLVVIDHGGNWHTAYASLGRITVKKGEKVKAGERIGVVGNTSITKRTELHFEMRRNGKPIDPLQELPRQP